MVELRGLISFKTMPIRVFARHVAKIAAPILLLISAVSYSLLILSLKGAIATKEVAGAPKSLFD